MRLPRLEPCRRDCGKGWQRLTGDQFYEVQKRNDFITAESASHSAPWSIFRLCTVSVPTFVVAVGDTLDEILNDWHFVSSTASGHPPLGSATRLNKFISGAPVASPASTVSQIWSGRAMFMALAEQSNVSQTYSRLGGCLSVLSLMGLGPFQSLWCGLVFLYCFFHGLLVPALLLWLVWCLCGYLAISVRNPGALETIQKDTNTNLSVAAVWAGSLSNTINGIIEVATWRDPVTTRVVIVGLAMLLFLCSLGHLSLEDWETPVIFPLVLAFIAAGLARAVHLFAPTSARSWGIMDPLGFLWGCLPNPPAHSCPQPAHHPQLVSLDWAAALPRAHQPATLSRLKEINDTPQSTLPSPTSAQQSQRPPVLVVRPTTSAGVSPVAPAQVVTSTQVHPAPVTVIQPAVRSSATASATPTAVAAQPSHVTERSRTSDLTSIFDQVEAFRRQGNLQQSLNVLEAAYAKESSNPEILWRLAMVHIDMTSEPDKKIREKHVRTGLDYCQKALAIAPGNASVHKWNGICLGKLSDYISIKEKVANALKIRDAFQKSIELDDTDYLAHYALGQWFWNVAKITWMEKKLASTIFGFVPEGTYADAERCYMRCHQLNPHFAQNLTALGDLASVLGDKAKAKEWYQKALDPGLEVHTDAAKRAQAQARKALQAL